MCLRRLSSVGCWIVAAALAVAVAGSARAEPVTLDKPVPVSQKKADKSRISGRIVSYDDEGFDVATSRRSTDESTERVRWDELDARTHFVIRKSLIRPRDAAAHVGLGRVLLGVDGGKEWAEKAFALALKLDPDLKKEIEAAKQAAAEGTLAPGKISKKAGHETGVNEEGTRVIGRVQEGLWGPLSKEEQAAAIAELKAFAAKAEEKMNKQLSLNETSFFLFYSDLDAREARNWSGLLDRMYGMLADLFGVDRNTNIWRGKALIFVFKSPSDYARFERLMYGSDIGTSIGRCHSFGSGMVHISFFRQSDELKFAHVLVHESAHGFLHRYKSPVHVPSWANEGLAEWISNQLLIDKRPNRAREVLYRAQQYLREYRGLGAFFEAEQIEGWQYPVAEMLTTFMIERRKKGYVAFIDGIKEGLSWEESLKTRYKESREQLVRAFAEAMKVRLD